MMDPKALEGLVRVMREYQVTELSFGETRIVRAPALEPATEKDAKPARRPPSFEDFEDDPAFRAHERGEFALGRG